jgi:hypothetical protein
MSKAKSKSEPTVAVDTATLAESTPTQTTPEAPPVPAPTHGWQFNWTASGVAGVRGYLEFGRLASAAVRSTGNAARLEADAATKEFLATDPAALHYAKLRERLAKAESDYNAIEAEHREAQARFVDDPAVAPELVATASKEAGLASQIEALGNALRPALVKAQQAYSEFQRRYDTERTARLRAECLALAAKIEAAVAPLLTEFGVARDALRQENVLDFPLFNSLFPAPVKPAANDEPLPQFNLTANGAPVVADNRMHMVPQHRPADPNWMYGKAPVRPAMQRSEPIEEAVEEGTTNGGI